MQESNIFDCTAIEDKLAKFCDTSWNYNIFKAGAVIECTVINLCNSIWNIDVRELFVPAEKILANYCDPLAQDN